MTRNALEKAVVAAMDAATETPMRWGVDDCALWVADIIAPVLGYDPAAEVRGHYKTRRGSMRITGRAGLPRQLRIIAKRHAWKRVPPFLAQPGDVGLAWTMTDGKPVLATVVCRSLGWFVGRAEGGVTLMRDDKVAAAWSVLPDQRVTSRRFAVAQMTQDPVTIGVAALGFFGVTGTSAVVAGVVGYAILAVGSIALSIGVSLVSSLLQPSSGGSVDQTTSDTSPIQGAQITERQAVPYKRVIVGSAYVGGALFFEQVKPPYLTMGTLINHGPITAIDKVFVGTDQIGFTAIVPDTILTPIAVIGQPNYPARLRVSFRYGSNSQVVDPLVLAKYPNIGIEFRQRGIAAAVYEFHFGTDQADFTATWGQVARPNTFTVVRGVAVYDPRDATQLLADSTTWKWSNNATLVQTWYLTQLFGGRILTANIRWDKIAVSANYDDELIGCLDGTFIKRHTIDGVIMLNQQPFNVMQDLLTANRAMVLESGGQTWIESSRPKTSICTIHDRILAGGITYQAAKQKTDKVNKLQVRFVSPDQDYQIVDGPILDRTDLQTTDGRVLTATLALNYTQDYRRAERLQKAFLLSSRVNGSITCTVDIRLMAIAAQNVQEELIGSVLTVDSVLFSKMNGTYLVTAVGFADDCTTLSLALARYDASIERNWNPETDETPFTLATINTA